MTSGLEALTKEAHNPEVAGSNPVPATIKVLKSQDFRTFSLLFGSKDTSVTSGFSGDLTKP